ncbi:MAG TPA: antibiotic biosynthesis monooxygenase [Chloroflexia bacterium]|nr:antibiotic biosynthesis monooxygenase [Chloroflexia bacterium]
MLVAIVRVPAPPTAEAAAVMEQRFADRVPLVAQAAGFLGFELLRPADGAPEYLSISRWASRADFEAWRTSTYNAQAHGRPAAPAGDAPSSGPAPQRGAVELYEVAGV